MAIIATVKTNFGEERELYIRLNNLEDVGNHGETTKARFRGFISEEAFKSGAFFVWEKVVEFKADVSKSLWRQAYKALRADDPAAAMEQAVEALRGKQMLAEDAGMLAQAELDATIEMAVVNDSDRIVRQRRLGAATEKMREAHTTLDAAARAIAEIEPQLELAHAERDALKVAKDV